MKVSFLLECKYLYAQLSSRGGDAQRPRNLCVTQERERERENWCESGSSYRYAMAFASPLCKYIYIYVCECECVSMCKRNKICVCSPFITSEGKSIVHWSLLLVALLRLRLLLLLLLLLLLHRNHWSVSYDVFYPSTAYDTQQRQSLVK